MSVLKLTKDNFNQVLESDKKVLIEKDEKAQNIMSVSLLRLPNGNLGAIYLRKEITTR